MQFATLGDVTVHYRHRPAAGVPIVFLNSLRTDLRIWDAVIASRDADMPILQMDKRGHGLSDDGPISMDLLVADLADLMDQEGQPPALACGVSVGGLIAQGLSSARPDLVAGLILCCTGAKIGDAEGWNARIETVEARGVAEIADTILERWFSRAFRTNRRAEPAGYRNMLIRTSPVGYAAVCKAIRDSDFTDVTLPGCPTHCLAGVDDLAIPAALVRDFSSKISGATIELFEDCGHLPFIEAPHGVAEAIRKILRRLA